MARNHGLQRSAGASRGWLMGIAESLTVVGAVAVFGLGCAAFATWTGPHATDYAARQRVPALGTSAYTRKNHTWSHLRKALLPTSHHSLEPLRPNPTPTRMGGP